MQSITIYFLHHCIRKSNKLIECAGNFLFAPNTESTCSKTFLSGFTLCFTNSNNLYKTDPTT